jgi:nitric oxide reductase NorD protein
MILPQRHKVRLKIKRLEPLKILMSYRGEYGIEDTRQALFETRQLGIHPFCITIDDQASDYLPRMYGCSNYVMVEDVRELPVRVSDIYRKLTT